MPPLRIGVRRARPKDKTAVLSFATATWDGWDYIPDAWEPWLAAPDGVVLVAEVRSPDIGEDGTPVAAGRTVAMSRIALVAEGEAWLEGIRVDPAVRGRDVATNLQVAELAWARAHGATVIRYATGQRNEGSLHLGARHGFRMLADRRTYGRREDGSPSRPTDPSAVNVLASDAASSEVQGWWRFVEADPTFAAGDGLYECRHWAFQAVTGERFAAHVRRGEVLLARDERALLIAPRSRSWLDPADAESPTEVALLAGDGASALSLLNDLRRAAGAWPRIRLPDPAPLLEDPAVSAAWAAAGFVPHESVLKLLARDIPPDASRLPAAEPRDALELLEPPRRVAAPPRL